MGGLKITGYSEAELGKNKIWHAGNDGSGSGLDADLLDGYHAAGIFTYEGETYVNGESSLWNSLGTKGYANALPDGLTNVYNYGQTISFGVGNAKFDMYVSHVSTSPNYDNSNGGIYVRSGWQSDRVHWRRLAFIDSNVASATNADTVDGYHLSVTTSAGTNASTIYFVT